MVRSVLVCTLRVRKVEWSLAVTSVDKMIL